MSWIHESSVGDLLSDVLVLVEGERATQADVHDDAHRPHVQRAVVAAAADHLGRQVGRRPHDRATERLLADDAGEAEVTQLHLQRRHRVDLTRCCVLKHIVQGNHRIPPEGRGPQRPAGRSQVSGHSERCV